MNEEINHLLGYNDMKIIQRRDMFTFSLDTVLLANFCAITKDMKTIVDFGTNNAAIPLILTQRTHKKIIGVEIQKEAVEIAERNVKLNHVENQVEIIHDDIKEYVKYAPRTKAIVCNPPFFRLGEKSHVNESPYVTIARHEIKIDLEGIIASAAKILDQNGRFSMVYRPDRFIETIELFKKYRVEPKRIRFVYPKEGKECKIEDYPELIKKYETVTNPNEFIMALPVMFRKSKKFVGRGKSLFDGKLDNFDAFDEVWSQWMLALRKGQIKTYIPESLLPRDPNTGLLLRGSDLDNDFISTEEDVSEDGASKNKITTTQGQIQHEALLSTYITALDQCLTGLISPSTLGIDTKKIDNAEATREKEKTTLYKRNQIVEVLTKVISDMVDITFKVYDTMNGKGISDNPGTASFGGYANPSFEAQIETISKAKMNGIMSVETSVEELYGDTKDEKWKKEEVQRIKNESGIVDMDEPSINEDLDLIENEEILNAKGGDFNGRK